MRNTFVGLAGGWGTVLMGRHDTPLKISTGKLDLFADTLADMNATVGFQDLRTDNTVAYISPSFSGFTLAAAVVPSGGATAGFGLNPESDGINEAWSIAGIYSNGPFYGSLAYESLGYELFNSSTDVGCGPAASTCVTSGNDWNKWRVGLGLLDWNGFTLTGIYEAHEGIAGGDWFDQGTVVVGGVPVNWVLPYSPDKMDLWQISAGYAFGNTQIKAMYGAAGFESDNYVADPTQSAAVLNMENDIFEGDREVWAIGVDHNFSKRTKVYALYTDVSDDRADWVAGSEWSGFSLGLMHSF
jgi:predicted porin